MCLAPYIQLSSPVLCKSSLADVQNHPGDKYSSCKPSPVLLLAPFHSYRVIDVRQGFLQEPEALV